MPLRRAFRPLHRQAISWWAACCLALGTVLPLLSHAVVRAPADGTGWVEVCSATGALWVRAEGAGDAGSPQAGHGGPASAGQSSPGCDLCAGHAPIPGMPAQPPVATPAVPDPAPGRPRDAAPSTVGRSWFIAHPRGPPEAP